MAELAPGADLVVNRLADLLFHTLDPRPHRIAVESLQKRLAAGDFRSADRCRSQILARESGTSLDSRISGRGVRYVAFRFCGSLQGLGWGDTPSEVIGSSRRDGRRERK